MSVLHLARAALSMPPRVAAAKAMRFAGKLLKERLIGRLMRRQCTYPGAHQVGGALARRLAPLPPEVLAPHAEGLRRMAADTLAHRFDLLGSGPVVVSHGARYAGFGPHRHGPGPRLGDDWRQRIATGHWRGNQMHALALLGMIEDPAYRPIDWQVDFKSGYRWSVRCWGPSSPYAHKPGVDIKVPWELARLQHLPRLALAYALDKDGALADEFHDQVLDFLGSNPPGWGVNWACAMDVAIRAANLVLAWDLFRAHGAAFPPAFEEELAAALLAHGRHVAHHLEWSPGHRGNHYLADIAGLAFVACALPRSDESDLWLVFCAQQLEIEIGRQFLPDGGNFEASTAYHRLSSEMALFAVALILGLPEERRAVFAEYDAGRWGLSPGVAPGPMAWPPFAPETLDRLARAVRFARDVTKPSGLAVQIGDNDSGRFFALTPGLVPLDLSHLWRADSLENRVLGLSLPDIEPAGGLPGREPEETARTATRVVVAAPDPAALDGLTPFAYPAFGLYGWRNARAFVAIRCGRLHDGLGAHAHADQLAVEIEIDGVAFARDPGTFVYTPDLAARNAYRSAQAHFVPRGPGEPARLDLGPFRLEAAEGVAVRFEDWTFLGHHAGFGERVWRRVLVGDGTVVVEDCRGGPMIDSGTMIEEHRISSPAELARLWGLDRPFSPGYGAQE